jgi:subtilase family serine protease
MAYSRITWSKLFLLFLLTGFTAVALHAQAPSQGVDASPRITAVVDDSNLVTLEGNVHPLATAADDQGAAPGSLELGRAILVLKGSAAQQAALNKLTDDQQNSKSPNYHVWLTPAEYGARFGVAPQDLAKINNWLQSHGFTVEPQMAGRNLIIFSGTNAQLKQAFQTELHTYKVNGQNYTANATNPQIPAAFNEVISSFSPNNFPLHAEHTTPKVIQHTDAGWKDVAGAKPQLTTTLNGATYYVVAPYDLATIYNILPLWNAGIDGTGETIAIVSDSNINPTDVDSFRTEFGLPAKKLNIIIYGTDPGRGGDEVEADLDVQWSGAVAKNATIDLVVSADTSASQGVFGSAIYIINNNLAPLLNVSYGLCEQSFGTANNQLFNLFWEQAASQGITVLSASGDALIAACDQGQPYDVDGMGVNALATTAYNVSVGGTDFSGNFPNPSQYWSATNNPTTLASALSYIPETPWNDSCASPEILAALQANGSTTDQTNLALCNDPNESNYSQLTGGGGGASNCYVTGPNATNPCISGYPKPAWQSGVNGIPNDGVRDQPDVSLMAGNGMWGSFYPICDSDISGGPCNTTGYVSAGGTSFSTPIFAGMLALVQQQQGAAALGNINYVLYKLGAAEYANSSSTACSSSTVAAGNSCVFYDITQGTIAGPCFLFSPDCNSYGTTQQIGITSGYDANPGYDLATGLGSVNAYNLVEQWNSVSSTFFPTVTTLTAGSTTIVYGQNISLAATVAPVAPATGVPSGDVGFFSNDTAPGSASLAYATLSKGAGTVSTPLLSAGSYQLFANYAGDATFAPSESTGTTVTVTKATPVTALTSSLSSVQTGQNVTFSLTESGVLNGFAPTGTVVFTDTKTGAILPTETLPQSTTFNGTPFSIWFVTVPASQIQPGANTITAVYSGDSNYLGATAAPVTVTEVQAAFTTSFSQSSVTLTNGTGTLTVTVTPSGSTPLTANSIVLSCPSAVGLTCTFSPNVVGSDGVLTSTLTVKLVSSATASAPSPIRKQKTYLPPVSFAGGLAGLLLLMIPKRRRNYGLLSLCVVMLSGLMLTVGCSSAIHSSPVTQPSLISTSTVLSVTPTAPVLGGAVVFTAKVTPISGNGVPTGSITFMAGNGTLGTSVLNGGSATFTTTSLPLGSQAVMALYNGDAAFNISSSAVTLLNVSSNVALTVTATDALGYQSSANVAVIFQ